MTEPSQKPKIMVENISCILPQQSNSGALFLGNIYGAQNPIILKQYGIRAVLTSSIETDIKYQFQDIPFHMKIEAHDKQNYNLKEHINKCIDFIQKAREFTNVYVHCFAGVSRSAAIVCAYIMWKLKWNYQTTIAFVKAKRIVAKPNEGFVRQLLQIEKILLQQSSYISPDNFPFEKSQLVVSQFNSNTIPSKQQPQYLNSPPIEQRKSLTSKKQNIVHQRVSSNIANPYLKNGVSNGNQVFRRMEQSKYFVSPTQSVSYTQNQYQNDPILTNLIQNQHYQNIQSSWQKNGKSDRFLYLKNFFPQNHPTQKITHDDQKLIQNYQKPIQSIQKPRNTMSLNSTGQNWAKHLNEKPFSVTSTQSFNSVITNQNSNKNLNTQFGQKIISQGNQVILGGKKQSHTHNSTAVPKVFEKRYQQKNNNQYHHHQRISQQLPPYKNKNQIQQSHRATMGIDIMPKVNQYLWNGGQQKFSIKNFQSQDHIKSPTNNNQYNKKFDFRNTSNTDGFFNTRSTSHQKETQKATSKLLVKPKDLPGYKNYS